MREAKSIDDTLDERQAIKSLASIEAVWEKLIPAEQGRIIRLLVEKAVVSPTNLHITLKNHGMKTLAQSLPATVLREAA